MEEIWNVLKSLETPALILAGIVIAFSFKVIMKLIDLLQKNNETNAKVATSFERLADRLGNGGGRVR